LKNTDNPVSEIIVISPDKLSEIILKSVKTAMEQINMVTNQQEKLLTRNAVRKMIGISYTKLEKYITNGTLKTTAANDRILQSSVNIFLGKKGVDNE
jgi:hypothetical protein